MNTYHADRRWIDRLQELPKYRPIIEKLVLGASPDAVTDWLLQETVCGPLSGLSRSTVRLYLIGLKVQVETNFCKNTKSNATERPQQPTQTADGFSRETKSKAAPAARHPEFSGEEIEAEEKQNLSSTTGELNSDGLVRLIYERLVLHIQRMAELEKKLNLPLPGMVRAIEGLLELAKIQQKNELSDNRSATQLKTALRVSEPKTSEKSWCPAKSTVLEPVDKFVKNSTERKTAEAKVN